MPVRSLLAVFVTGLSLAAAASSARTETVAVGAVARLELPPGAVARALPEPELGRLRAERGASRLLLAGTITGPDRLRARWEFHRAGRLAEPGPEALDMRALAERLTADGERWSFAGWRVPPVFDREHHVLFWAYDVKRPDGRRTLSYAAFCTRDGVLLFQRASENVGAFQGEEVPFRRLLAGVRILEGRRWQDFVATDPLAAGGMDELVANRGVPGGETDGARRSASDPAGPRLPWAVVPLLAAGGLAALVTLARVLRAKRGAAEEIRMPPGASAPPPPIEPEEPRRRR